MIRKVAIFRTSSSPLNMKGYNVQEIGLAKGFADIGISTDIYSRFVNIDTLTTYYSNDSIKIQLIPLKGTKIANNIVFINNLFLLFKNKYNIVQVHEDSQLMTPIILLISKWSNSTTVLYQGMYKDYSGAKLFMQKGYDLFFSKIIINKTDFFFAKTKLAKTYLDRKLGLGTSYITKVGISTPEVNLPLNIEQQQKLDSFKDQFRHILLYIGIIEVRRNVKFILEVFNELNQEKPLEYGLIIVGDGPEKQQLLNRIDQLGLMKCVLYFERIPQNQIRNIYDISTLFLLPSLYEIYGMVILESLFYGLAVISSKNAGALDILKRREYGVCLELDKDSWIKEIHDLVLPTKKTQELRTKYIVDNFNWHSISKAYIRIIMNKSN